MTPGEPRAFTVGVTWSFPPEQLDDVLTALDHLPDELQECCVYLSAIEFDVVTRATSLEQAGATGLGRILDEARSAHLPGRPMSIQASDDTSWQEWAVVDGRDVEKR